MSFDEMEIELRKSLEDQRLSRSERRALGALVKGLDARSTAKLRHLAFEIARSELDGSKHSRHVLAWLEEVVKTLDGGSNEKAPSRACFSPGQEPRRTIVGLLGAARSEVDICVFTITDDRVTEAILEAHGRGVKVRIITDDDKSFDRGSDIERLRAAGVRVCTDRSEAHMHHKFAIFDKKTLLTGSYNWTRSAAEHNHENLVVTGDPQLTAAFADVFDTLWTQLS